MHPDVFKACCFRFMLCRTIGTDWSALYVNGYNVSIAWDSLVVDEWAHIHLEALYSFEDDIDIFARVASGDLGCLKGRLASVYLWDRTLPHAELAQIARQVASDPIKESIQIDNFSGLMAYFNIEEGQGRTLKDALHLDLPNYHAISIPGELPVLSDSLPMASHPFCAVCTSFRTGQIA